jgi:hypothetical protein
MKVTDLLNNAALEYIDYPLPSKGLVYPNGLKSVKVRPTKTTEEKFLRTIARGSSDFNEKISKYLGLVTNFGELGFNPTELTTPDQLALLIYSRIISKDTVLYPLDIVCPNCGKISRLNVNLMELKTLSLPDDFSEPQEVHLPIHDLYLGVRLLRVKDHINVAEYYRTLRAANVVMDEDPESDFEALYASAITSVKKGVNGENISMTFSDRRDLLLNLDAKSFNIVSGFQDKYYHGYDMKVDFECKQCLEKTQIPFDLGPDFFFKVTSTAA